MDNKFSPVLLLTADVVSFKRGITPCPGFLTIAWLVTTTVIYF
jgi:hypothetical protein